MARVVVAKSDVDRRPSERLVGHHEWTGANRQIHTSMKVSSHLKGWRALGSGAERSAEPVSISNTGGSVHRTVSANDPTGVILIEPDRQQQDLQAGAAEHLAGTGVLEFRGGRWRLTELGFELLEEVDAHSFLLRQGRRLSGSED